MGVEQGLYIVKKMPVKGRGCVALRCIKKGTVIMINQMVEIPARQHKHISETILSRYRFALGRKHFIILGDISIVNHADTPNTDYFMSDKTRTAKLVALADIPKGAELFIDYGYRGASLLSHYGIPTAK